MAETRNAPDGATTKPPFEMGAGDWIFLKQLTREEAIAADLKTLQYLMKTSKRFWELH